MTAHYPCEIRSEHLLFREFRPSDADAVVRISRENTEVFAPLGEIHDVPSFERWLSAIDRGARARRRMEFRLAVERADTGALIGIARVCDEQPARGIGSIGYGLSALEWGQGFGTEAASAMLEFGFSELGLHRLEATIRVDNERSLRIARRLGMILEGRLRDYFWEEGKRADAYLYSILAPEWHARKELRS
ncbi:MAG TPA: GNAT family protein [Actinomycetota bacterium]|nr:GNAT family protein [Actinomycetota bacterium]